MAITHTLPYTKSSIRKTIFTLSLSAVATLTLADSEKEAMPSRTDALDNVLQTQPAEAQARYQYRHPQETLTFFGIEPGMTVVEALPGGGWYSKILLPYLGKGGALIGVDYAQDMWPNFSWVNAEFTEEKKTWVSTWTAEANEWRDDSSATIAAFQFKEMPDDMKGSADAVLFIRALHNMARFEDKGAFLSGALQESYDVLKPGGIVGVVQHAAREDRPDEWADGSSGYLKQSTVVKAMEAAGFEYVEASDINANDKDQATEGDIVWRLPPSLNGAKEDEEKRAAMLAIGESNRMTLKFRKPIEKTDS